MSTAFFIYLVCFGVGVCFSLVSGLLAGGLDGHAEPVGHDASTGHAFEAHGGHTMPAFSPWNPMLMAAFLAAFGGLGMLFDQIPATHAALASAPLAAVGALVVATLVFWLFSAIFRRTQASSECQVALLVGQTAILNTSLPERGLGEIAYIQGGARYTAAARAEDGRPLPQGATVRITRLVGSEFFVVAC